MRKYCREALEVCEDQVVDPHGKHTKFSLVKMPAGVCVLPVDDSGNVYLTCEFRYALGRDSVEAVGGVVEQGEHPSDAARRELKEELGIDAEQLHYLGHVDPVTSIISSPVHLFVARDLGFGNSKPDHHEEISMMKLSLEAAARMVGRNEITHAESCTLILRAYLQTHL